MNIYNTGKNKVNDGGGGLTEPKIFKNLGSFGKTIIETVLYRKNTDNSNNTKININQSIKTSINETTTKLDSIITKLNTEPKTEPELLTQLESLKAQLQNMNT